MSKDDQHQIFSSLKKDLAPVNKYQEVIVHLFEFGYDLARSPEKFESILSG